MESNCLIDNKNGDYKMYFGECQDLWKQNLWVKKRYTKFSIALDKWYQSLSSTV